MQDLVPYESFTSFSTEHFWPVFVGIILGAVIIQYALKQENIVQEKLLFYISLVPFFSQFSKILFQIVTGSFIVSENLPLYLCNVMALTAPWIILKKSHYWKGIIYYWIMGGTLQAILTPDVLYGFPHWIYFQYFTTHIGLMFIPIYYVIVLGERFNLKSVIQSILCLNVFLLITLAVNHLLESNYMYTMYKPISQSALDLLGPWPWYILQAQLLISAIFFILWIPVRQKR